ncbi:MAG TPA: arginase family protein [Xanthobacteraceae bacterium]|nr:arginase family protein [Xanthobacteraceae bacterium]
MFGGDCLVNQAPVAYLNERYEGKLGVLWFDAHPDVKTPKDYPNAHTMVLGNLLGEGDPEMATQVKVPLDPKRVLFAGLRSGGLTEQEQDVIKRRDIGVVHTEELNQTSKPILDWVKADDIRHIAIHFDLDVLDPKAFRSIFFGEPEPEIDPVEAFPAGTMSFEILARILKDVHENTEIVGLAITEHLPWDAINLRNLLMQAPILR